MWYYVASGAAVLVAAALVILVTLARRRATSQPFVKGENRQELDLRSDTTLSEKPKKGPDNDFWFIVPEEALVDKAEQLKKSVLEISGMARKIISDTNAFSSQIGDHKRNLIKLRTLTEIHELEKRVIDALSNVQETNSQITKKLSASAKKIYEQEKLVDQLRVKSVTDSLTNLYNRAGFEGKIREELERFRRYNSLFTLIMADIDWFKRINDTYGHSTGDNVLQIIGKLILTNIRTIDFAARYGGEEFAVILPETKLEEGYNIADRIRRSTEKTNFKHGEKRMNITLSFGVAMCDKEDTYQSLIDKADSALYKAKDGGRNQVILGE